MKKACLSSVLFLFSIWAFSQSLVSRYNSLIKKADNYYWLINYKASASTYSVAFKLMKWQIPAKDKYSAACSFSLAGIPDSAFYYLNSLVTKDAYSDYLKITNDADLKSLHGKKQWSQLISIAKKNEELTQAKLNHSLIKELDTILFKDQEYRIKLEKLDTNPKYRTPEVKNLYEQMRIQDSVDLIKIKAILDTYGWLGPDVIGEKGNGTLFLIIQHADLTTQEHYLPMFEEAVKNKNADAADLALLQDRIALRKGKKQIYGSQIVRDLKTGKDTIAPIEDFAHVNIRRAEVGLQPLEDYVRQWGIVFKQKPIVKKNTSLLRKVSNDFSMAEEIKDSVVGPVNVSKGYGTKLDYMTFGNNREHNTAWFRFKIDVDTILTFDIVPSDPDNDYDFIVFKCSEQGCSQERAHPERSCFSINYDKSGSTGLSQNTFVSEFLPREKGPGYVAGLPIKAGEIIYLMVDWPYEYSIAKGFTIYFYNYWPDKPASLKMKKAKPAQPSSSLENINFENNKTTLGAGSYVILNKIVKLLQDQKQVKLEIKGYSDNHGNEIQNLKLSQERAKEVAKYLISKKIEPARISYKGFGSKQPLYSNDTPEGREKNRRVEFVVIK